jgi:DNA-directed RNA polymerase specialized sigma24 family protein
MDITGTADPFELTVARQERLEPIKRALEAMSDVEQQVLLDHDRGAKSLAWIAERVGITRAEARQALISARAQLQGIPGV